MIRRAPAVSRRTATDLVVDEFAGPGGWDLPAADVLGFRPVGIEHDASACATRAAAGHLTIRADVSEWLLPRRPVAGLIGSPPCQTFSAAGNRDGMAHLGALVKHVHDCATGWRPFTGADTRTTLVLEPLRFALECVPDWIALEQVPDVLPIWEAYAYTLRALGWSVWTGILNSADFGVPQTRRRAILMAHRRKVVQPPSPTHCEGGALTMFGELLPWVSMAEALGWGMPRRPSPTVAAHRTDMPFDQGWCAEMVGRRERGDWIELRERQPHGARCRLDQPAMTIPASADNGNYAFWPMRQPATTVMADTRISARCHHEASGQGSNPKTTDQVRAGDYEGTEPIKLTVRDALILQSFPPDYPVQGTKTKQFEQVGNAIPPMLAHAILQELTR